MGSIAYRRSSRPTPNLALQRTPHRRGAFSGIIACLGGAGPLSFVIRRRRVNANLMESLIIVGLLLAVFGCFGAWVAVQKQRGTTEGIILGLLFGPLGVLVEALLPQGNVNRIGIDSDDETSPSTDEGDIEVEGDMDIEAEGEMVAVDCLACGGEIAAGDSRCRNCGWTYGSRGNA